MKRTKLHFQAKTVFFIFWNVMHMCLCVYVCAHTSRVHVPQKMIHMM